MPVPAFDFCAPSRFELRARVGRGAVGVVYEAFDHERSARVALKVLHTRDPEALLSLKKEFRAVQDIRHPNLVHVGELFEESGSWFFTMEFVDGSPFVGYVRPHDAKAKASMPAPFAPPPPSSQAGPGFDETRLRAALSQLVRGVMALHENGKVHRDLKPSNVLVTDEGRVVVLDFGVASDVLRDHEESDHGMVGTAAYMAPEQALGDPIGPAADWYAVGVVLYQALAGRLPFYGSMHEVLASKVAREPPRPSTLVPAVPADLDALCADLLAIDPARRPDGRAILAVLGASERTEGASSGPHLAAGVFVGRARELTELDEAYADTLRGRAVTMFVHGESGVGKSFLVRRFLNELRERDKETLVLAGRCFERESVPYKAVDGVVDQLSSHLASLDQAELRELLPDQAQLFVRAFPVLARAIRSRASEHGDVINPQELRARLFSAMRTLFERLAVRSPVVVAIDDLQWADRDSLALLAEITRRPDAPPILLVVTMRIATERVPQGSFKEMASLHDAEDVRHLQIEQLPRDEARALAARLLGEQQVDSAALDAIVDEANGHPLFIDELVRQRTSVQRIKLMKLDDALWSRVSRLGSHARRLLELVAVAGVPIPQGVAADAAAIDLGQLFDLAAVLRSAHFAKTGGTRREDKIEPYHDRVRESVLAHLDPDVRARWHARLATALERADTAPDPEALATHWHAAGNVHRAAEYAERAADGAMQNLAFERAARLYRFALEMDQHPKEARLDIERRLAEALTNAGYVSEAAEVRIALANEVGGAAALDLRRRAAEQLLCSGRFDTGLELLRSVLDAVGIYFPRSPLIVILSVLVARVALVLRGLKFVARDASQASADELTRADAAWAAGAGFSMTDNIRGAYFQTRNLIACLRIGDPHRVSRALAMEVCFRSAGGAKSLHRSRALLAREWELAKEVNTSESIAMACTASGYVDYMLGRWTEAAPMLERGEELFRDRVVGAAFQLNSCRMMLYRVLAYQGRFEELAIRVPPVLREVQRQSDNYSVVNLQAGPMALLGLADDLPEKVRDALANVNDQLPRGAFLVQHYFAVMAQCQLDLYCGDGVGALARVQETWPALRRSLLLRVQGIKIISLEQRARAAVAATVARVSSGDHLAIAEKDARRLASERIEWGVASATMIRAAVAAARERKDEAIALFDEATMRFDALGMAVYAAATRRRAGELRGGEAGDVAVREADEAMAARGVKRPDRMASVFAPPVARR